MIKYITLSSDLTRSKKFTTSEKFLYSIIGVLTDKGNNPTTVSDSFLAEELGTSPIMISRMLKSLKDKETIFTYRKLGRRQIELFDKSFIYQHEAKKGKTK